jgi:hypothetical protein
MLSSRLDRRGRGLALLVLAVLLAHAALLGGIGAVGPETGAAAPPPIQLRAVLVDASLPLMVDTPVAAPPAPVAAPVRPRPRAVRTAAPAEVPMARPAEPAASQPEEVAAAEAAPEHATPVVAVEQPREPASAAAAAESSASDAELPTYRTRPPPPATLVYDLQRGRLAGSGELRWSPTADDYELALEGSIVGLNLLTQVSRGAFDAAGLAPQRFTDRRARRPAQAASFDRTNGRVTFSGPSFELPLRPGVQDRLSWMIQLAAIAAADAQWLAPGAKLTLQVVGARGDAALWVFRCVGAEPLDTAAGAVEAVRFVREPRGPYDTGVEVWLDPARHHLPVRATIRNGGEGEALELRLREARLGG